MPKSKLCLCFAALAAVGLTFAAVPAPAQEKPGNVVRVYLSTAKPGMGAELEAGRKRHVAAHKAMGDTWGWYAFQAETGPNGGMYHVVTFGHHWKDFDAWDKKYADADNADAAKNLEPNTAGGMNFFLTTLTDVSTPSMAPNPQPLTQLIHFDVKIGSEAAFFNAIRKFHEAIQKTKWSPNGQPATYFWYAVADGGESPHYVLAIPLRGWADMEEGDPPFPAMLEKAYGRTEAQAILESFSHSVKKQWSEVIRYRPELSYVPAM